MKIPDFCYTKIFWTIICSSFAFTFFIYNVLLLDIQEVKADFIREHDDLSINLHENQKMLVQIKEDVGFVKAKLSNYNP